jgi:hypothetical protein
MVSPAGGVVLAAAARSGMTKTGLAADGRVNTFDAGRGSSEHDYHR